MKKIIQFTALTLLIILATGCSSKPKLKEGWTVYENKALNFKLDYPQLFTLKEDTSKVTLYHFEKQPVPYFVVNVYSESLDSVVKKINEKILKDERSEKNDMDARAITTFNRDLNKNIETYYFENENKTYSFSCFDGLYEEICSTFEFIN